MRKRLTIPCALVVYVVLLGLTDAVKGILHCKNETMNDKTQRMMCHECEFGYYLSSVSLADSCNPCSSVCLGCTTTASMCLKCNPGYYMSGTTCTTCSTGCEECISYTNCKRCREGLDFDNNGYTCSKKNYFLTYLPFIIPCFVLTIIGTVWCCICCCLRSSLKGNREAFSKIGTTPNIVITTTKSDYHSFANDEEEEEEIPKKKKKQNTNNYQHPSQDQNNNMQWNGQGFNAFNQTPGFQGGFQGMPAFPNQPPAWTTGPNVAYAHPPAPGPTPFRPAGGNNEAPPMEFIQGQPVRGGPGFHDPTDYPTVDGKQYAK